MDLLFFVKWEGMLDLQTPIQMLQSACYFIKRAFCNLNHNHIRLEVLRKTEVKFP